MYAAHVLPAAREYGALYRSFRWQIPAFYNIGVDVCDRWAGIDPARTAIFNLRADGTVEEVSYSALREASNRLANALAARGIARGDRVAILLPQGPAVPIAHVAVYKLGAVALPLAALFGIDALSYRLQDAGAKALITNAAGLLKVARKSEKFDPEEAFRLMADMAVRNTFIPPTALRMLRSVSNPRGRFELSLRTIGSGGEALGAETFAWGREALGLTINEFYGQTE